MVGVFHVKLHLIQKKIDEERVLSISILQMRKQWKQWQTLFWGAPKSLQMVTAAMKLKDA